MLETMFINGRDLENNRGYPARAGVIPFTVYNHRLHFLLGIDRLSRDLTDFGGGVKSNETMVDAAYREFFEESCMVFKDVVAKEDLTDAPVVTNRLRNVAIFFLRIDSKWLNIADIEFRNKQQELSGIKKHNELIGVKWVEQDNFKQIVFNRKSQCLWKRIQNILCLNTNWNELRITLMLGPELTHAVKTSWFYLSNKGVKVPAF